MNVSKTAKVLRASVLTLIVTVFATCLLMMQTSAADNHYCVLGGEALNQANVQEFVDTVENYDVSQSGGVGMLTYYLDTDVSWDGVLSVPDGVYVGICLGEGCRLKGEWVSEGKGGVYVFSCDYRYISNYDENGNYVNSDYYIYVRQSLVDMYTGVCEALGVDLFTINNSSTICLYLDSYVTFDSECFVIPEGCTLKIHKGSYDFVDKVGMEKNGGKLIVTDDHNGNCLLNYGCTSLDYASTNILTSEKLAELDVSARHLYYLRSDFSWDGVLEIPEGMYVGVCLNGFELEGEWAIVDSNGDGNIEKGGLYTYLCCSEDYHEDEYDTSYFISQPLVDYIEAYYEAYGVGLFTDTYNYEIQVVLDEDVTFSNLAFAPPSDKSLFICLNDPNYGYTYTDNAGLESLGGSVTVNTQCHNCKLDIGMGSVGINQDIIADLLDVLEQVNVNETPTITIYLTSDIVLPRTMKIPKDMMILLCLNGYEFSGDYTSSGSGGLYIADCTEHVHTDTDIPMMSVNQAVFDYMSDLSVMLKDKYGQDFLGSLQSDLYLALSGDVVVDGHEWQLMGGARLIICENGYTFTDKVNMRANGAEIILTNCKPETSHTCDLVGTSDMYITNGNLKDVLAYVSSMEPEDDTVVTAYLEENVEWSDPISVPKGVTYVVCLNGHSAKGPVNNGGENGYIVFLEPVANSCEAAEQALALNGRTYPWIYNMLSSISFEDTIEINLVLDYDMSVDGVVCAPDNVKIGICLNGNRFNADIDNTLTGGMVFTYDCTITHECYMGDYLGVETLPIYCADTDILNNTFAELNDGEIALYYLTSDLFGEQVLIAPEGAIVGICLNGYSAESVTVDENSNIFFYESRGQYCIQLEEVIPAFDQGGFDFLKYVSADDPIELSGDISFGIIGDVVLPEGLFDTTGVKSAVVCSCGAQLSGMPIADVHTECRPGPEKLPDCVVCGTNHKTAKALTSYELDYITDSDGALTLPSGSYMYYLESDLHLPKTLIIPDGVDFHLCLGGYTLYSPYIWLQENDPDRPYAFNAVTVYPGATFSVYDCSETKSGAISIKFIYTYDQDGNPSIYVGNDIGLSGIGAIVATPILNSGTFNMYGGLLAGMVGLINQGTAKVENADVFGVLTSTIQGISESAEDITISFELGEGATAVGAMCGVISVVGDLNINGGNVIAGAVGVGDSLDGLGNYSEDNNLVINSGTITVGDIDAIYDCMERYDLGLLVDIATPRELVDSLESDRYVGISYASDVTMNGDIDIIIGDEALNEAEADDDIIIADLYLSGKSTVTAGATLNNFYSVSSKNTTVVESNSVFIPADGCMAKVNEEGELEIYPIPDDYSSLLKIMGMSASMDGDVRFNVYVQIADLVMSDEQKAELMDKIRFCVYYKGEYVYYDISDAKFVDSSTADGKTSEIYAFSIGTAPKDYKEHIKLYVINPDGTIPKVYETNLAYYLDELILNTGDIYAEETVATAKALKNYCMAAAMHFGTESSYVPVEGIGEYMDAVTLEELMDYAPKREGDVAGSKVSFLGATVVLKDVTSIKLYFDMATYVDENGETQQYSLDEVSITYYDSKGELVTVTPIATGIKSRPYCIEINGIRAKDMSYTYEISVDGAMTIKYSVNSYAYTVMSAPSRYSKDVVDVVKAMVVYNNAATLYHNYVTSIQEGGSV